MAEVIDYTSIVPDKPTPELIDYIKNSQHMKSNAIVFKAGWIKDPLTGQSERAARCTCTACGETSYRAWTSNECAHSAYGYGWFNEVTNKWIDSYSRTTCPECGAEVQSLHTNYLRYSRVLTECDFITVHNIDGVAVLVIWRAENILEMKEGTPYTRLFVNALEAYVFEKRKTVKLTHSDPIPFIGRRSWRQEWRQPKRFSDTSRITFRDNVIPFDNHLLDGTAMENAKLYEYCVFVNKDRRLSPVTYLRAYQKNKNIENLITCGCCHYIDGLIHNNGIRYVFDCHDIINRKKSKPHEMLGLTKEEFRYLKKQDFETFLLYRDIKEYIALKDLDCAKGFALHSLRSLSSLVGRKTAAVLKYMNKQKKKDSDADLIMYIDYYEMAKKINWNMEDKQILFPARLRRAHDQVIMLQELKDKKELTAKFARRVQELDKYTFEYENLFIRPCANEKELITEGKILHHCVASYAKSHAQGNTTIFFIRKKSEPDMPYYTLEYKDGKVNQNRGMRNCARTDEVKEFESEWIKYIDKIIKEEQKNGKQLRKAS